MEKIESACKGKRCVIVGSAPDTCVPKSLTRDEIFIAANAGVEVVFEEGLKLDVLTTTAYALKFNGEGPEKVVIDKIKNSLRGITVESVWVDTRNGGFSDVMGGLRELQIEVNSISLVNKGFRDQIVEKACGLKLGDGDTDERVSTGIFAVCLAIYSGATSVCLSGISMNSGHYNLDGEHNLRHHVQGDCECLRALSKLHLVETTSFDLSTEFGLSLVS